MAPKIEMEIFSATGTASKIIFIAWPATSCPRLTEVIRTGSRMEPIAAVGPTSHFSHLRFASAVQEHDPCPYRTGRRTFDTPPLQSCGGPNWLGAPALPPIAPPLTGTVAVRRPGGGIRTVGARLRAAAGGGWRRPGGDRRDPRPSWGMGGPRVVAWLGRLVVLRRPPRASAVLRPSRNVPGPRPSRQEVIFLPAVGDGEFDVWILDGSARVWYVVREGLITCARYRSADGREVRAWGEGEGSSPGQASRGGVARGEPVSSPNAGWRTPIAAWWQAWRRWGRLVTYALLGIAVLLVGVRVGTAIR